MKLDKLHFYLYSHPTNSINIFQGNDFSISKNVQEYKYNNKRCPMLGYLAKSLHCFTPSNEKIFLLVKSVIENGFEKDLLPKDGCKISFKKTIKAKKKGYHVKT